MLRRWCILLAMLALTVGTALAASSASAATTSAGRFSPGGPVHLVGADTHARGTGNQAESTNWSGYAATTGTYTSVSASWTQPAGTCSRGDQYAAFWVGLDGYSSSTVEQTGSEVDCIGPTAEYYAWYEMYPSASVSYSNKVEAGDHFNASVTYEGNNEFSLFIADTTQGWSHTTTASLAGAARSSAEVIVEAPCCTASGGILPLTNFGTMSFTGSLANGSAIGNAGGLTEIIMVDSAGRDKDTISSLSSGENFSATWLRSN
jgi:peptidase A4-like protein